MPVSSPSSVPGVSPPSGVSSGSAPSGTIPVSESLTGSSPSTPPSGTAVGISATAEPSGSISESSPSQTGSGASISSGPTTGFAGTATPTDSGVTAGQTTSGFAGTATPVSVSGVSATGGTLTTISGVTAPTVVSGTAIGGPSITSSPTIPTSPIADSVTSGSGLPPGSTSGTLPSLTMGTSPGGTASPTPAPSGATVASPTAIASSLPESAVSIPTTGPHTIMPTGSDSRSTQYIPSSILFEPTASSPLPSTASGAATGIPSSFPKVINPPSGQIPSQPENTTLVQIGFLYPLNYEFVVMHQLSIAQIFNYLPEGIAYGLNLATQDITMQTLQPYDTTETLGYVTTLAFAYIPTINVTTLSLDIHTPASALYNNPDESVKTLVSMINPSFPILAGGILGGSNPASVTGSSTSTASAIISEGAPLGGGMDNSSSVKGTSVAIGLGVVGAAAVYGAAMFFVAQRYRNKRRSAHNRSPSMIDTSVLAQQPGERASGAAAALMSGGRDDVMRSTSPYGGYGTYSGRNSRGSGRSGSTGRQISAPVMAENSLGWN